MTPTDDILHLTTYNIRLGIQQGLPAVAEVLKRQPGLDIVALQEVGDDWRMGPTGDCTEELARLLGLNHFLHVPALKEEHSDGSDARYGHALLSRWPLQGPRIISLPQYEDEPRALLDVEIKTPLGSVDVASTHLSHRDSDRPGQGEFLIRWLRQNHSPHRARFVLGDLNAPPTEDWISQLLKSWEDADGEKNRPTFPADQPSRRIDYILAQGARCLFADVPEETEASDHRPVTTRWSLST